MTILNISPIKQDFCFKNISYSSFVVVETTKNKFVFCWKNHQLLRLLIDKNQLQEKTLLMENSHDAYFPLTEDLRILTKAQENLSGIHYSPLLCIKNDYDINMICHARIDDDLQSQQLLNLTITLNTKGYYEIIHVMNLLL